ncbi:hypothetical protein V490_00532 [Pseudogymnoascus sp. VKM F-3557]|nr:hypothetical protein V490_00532 [Pseudogymnoascus sp. VKM F-3557]
METEYPDNPESWKRLALRSGISTDIVLDDLKSLTRRPNAKRHTRQDGAPRNKVTALSGSTARTDDALILRSILKRGGNNDKALDYLIDSKYADRRSWDNALERLGLQSVGGVLKPIALTAESEGERTQRTTGTPAPSRRATVAQEAFGTPVQQKPKPGTPQIPPAPRKEASEERARYVEGTETLHFFLDALCPSSQTAGFHKTAKLEVYGGFKTALKQYQTFQPWQMIGEAKRVKSSASILSNRPAGSDSPRPSLEPVLGLRTLRLATQREWPGSPTPGARSRGMGIQGLFLSKNSSTAKQPIVDTGNEDEAEDEDEGEDRDEPGISNLFASGEMTVVSFACNFTTELFSIRSLLPSNQTLALIPVASNFRFGAKSPYAVNARVDGVVFKAGFEYSHTMSPSDMASSHLLMAEFKAHKDSLVTNQMIFEFAAIISTIYGAGGEDSCFEGRYQLAIYQSGITLGIILAKYSQSWVQYIQNGNRAVVPADDLKEDEMLVLRVLHNFDLGDKDGGYKYSALLSAIGGKETAGLAV